jgi:hypothetical protein
VSPVKYELGFYIPADDILHCYSREHFISYISSSSVEAWAKQETSRRRLAVEFICNSLIYAELQAVRLCSFEIEPDAFSL